jgi:hypothetical protein
MRRAKQAGSEEEGWAPQDTDPCLSNQETLTALDAPWRYQSVGSR